MAKKVKTRKPKKLKSAVRKSKRYKKPRVSLLMSKAFAEVVADYAEYVPEGYLLYHVGEHIFYGKAPVEPSYLESILAKYCTPGLEKNQLTRSTKKLNMEFDENYRGWTKQERDEFLDKLFPEG